MGTCKCGCGYEPNQGPWVRGHWNRGKKNIGDGGKAMAARARANKGKSLEEIFGIDKATQLKAKMAAAQRGKRHPPEVIMKMSATRKGRHLTEVHKLHCSQTRKRLFAEGKLTLSPMAGNGRGGFHADIGHYVRSSYEHAFASWLKEHGIPYQYEGAVFTITVDGQFGSYRPDFLVNGIWFELKNVHNVKDTKFQKKWAAVRKQCPQTKFCLIVGGSPIDVQRQASLLFFSKG